ncbi:MAG TPA: hypothetical protein VGR95_10645 [Thermoanaerobaculia bacterium]|jgi:hypothetical protein|nr:hypothetical protein [Thermoanaerobaculia bacterium]
MTEAPAPAPLFNWIGFLGGLIIAIVCGGFANIFLGAMSMGFHNSFFGFLVGIAAGSLLIIFGLLSRRTTPGFAAGLLCGGCIIGLIGGICGSQMVNTSFR